MKLFLDDIRQPEWVYPEWDERGGDWVTVRTADDFREKLLSGEVTQISFDNDLGLSEVEGRHLFLEMIDLILDGVIPCPHTIYCHSANIVAYKFINQTWLAFDKDYHANRD